MRHRKTLVLSLLACMFLLMVASAEPPEPVWTYPLPANLLEDKSQLLVLVNQQALLDSSFVPENLVPVKLPGVSGPHELRKEAADALAALFKAAEDQGHSLYVKSSYRSYQTQSTMYNNRLAKYGRDDGVVAKPGSSDHQTGLGVDVLNREWSKRDGMTPAFGQTKEAIWMEENCASFGFIIRYLEEKQEITGIIYEPWHLRYIGKEAAHHIMENRLSLEEFHQEIAQSIANYEAQGGDFKALVTSLNAPPPVVVLNETDEDGDSEVSVFSGQP